MKKFQNKIFFLFFLFFLCFTCLMQNSWPYDHNLIMRDNYPESNNDFKGYVENVLNEYNIPSVQACIIKKNSEGKWDIAWKKAYGDSGTGQANNDTIYPIGSLTKIITSTAVLQLYDRGVIDIDENINTYLPELGIKNPHPDYAENEITIRHLLTHRSGIVCQLSYLAIKSINTSPYQYNWKPSHNPLEFYVFRNLAEIRNFLRKRNSKFWRHTRIMGRPEPDPVTGKVAYLNVWNKPDPRYVDDNVYYAPGEHFRYANTNYHILGYLIEKVACDPYGNPYISWKHYVKENILDPLGMTQTRFYWADYQDYTNNVAHGKSERKFRANIDGELISNGYGPALLGVQYSAGGAAGLIKSTASDMAKFMTIMLNNGKGYKRDRRGNIKLDADGKPEEVRILKSETVQEMHKKYYGGNRYISLEENADMADATGLDRLVEYGMGWMHVNWGGHYWNSKWNFDNKKNVNWSDLNKHGILKTVYCNSGWGGMDVEGHYGDFPGFHAGMFKINVGQDNNRSNDIAIVYLMNDGMSLEHRSHHLMKYSNCNKNAIFFHNKSLFQEETCFKPIIYDGTYTIINFSKNNKYGVFGKVNNSLDKLFWLTEYNTQSGLGYSFYQINGVLDHYLLGRKCEIHHLLLHKAATLLPEIYN